MPARLRTALLAAYLALALWLSGSWLIDGIPKYVVPQLSAWGGDCVTDWWAARAFWEGWNIYSPEGLKRAGIVSSGMGHPPSTPFWYLPFARFDPRGLHAVAGHISLLLLLAQLILVAGELGLPAPHVTAFLVFAGTLDQSWFGYLLEMVQPGVLLSLFYVLGWYFLRREKESAGGAMIGLACTIKFFPGLLVLLLAITRRWRAVASAAAGFLVVATIMTVRYGGPVCWQQYLGRTQETMDYWMAHIKNGSLWGIVLRLFWPACGRRGPVLPWATLLSVVGALLITALLWRLSRRVARRADNLDAPYALFAVSSVFFNPVVWEHYYVLLVPWILVAAKELWRVRGLGVPRWQAGLGALALAGVVGMLGIDMNDKTRLQAGRNHLGLHLYEIANWMPWLLTMLVLATVVFWLDRRRTDNAAEKEKAEEPFGASADSTS